MSNLTRDIGTEDMKIEELVKLLREDKFLIPTFQREFVWEPSGILKLWDSMFRFYPIGSLLYWETGSYLHTHRRLGGFEFPHDEDTVRQFKEWKYILDGQQRATSLLVCMLGGKKRVEGDEDFDYTLWFDSTAADFFFANELEKRKSKVSDGGLLIRVRDVPQWKFSFYKDISTVNGFNDEVEHNLQQLQRMFTDYKLSVVHIRGVEVSEVCEIFERINQEGKKLHPVDIIVARTYRNPQPEKKELGFYLRDNLDGLRQPLIEAGSRWQDMDDLLVIQMVAMCLRKQHKEGRNPFGITPAALDNLTTENLRSNWDGCQRTILDTVKFLTDQKILGPEMLPFAYLSLPLCYHFHGNKTPALDVARQWFWRNAFGLEDFRTSTDVYNYSQEFFGRIEGGKEVDIAPLTISRLRLVQASYNYRRPLSRAVLALLANRRPADFSDPHAEVLDSVYLQLSQTPNLHHIYPRSFLDKVEGLPDDASPDSLMNICYLRRKTNIEIGDQNPLTYFKHYQKRVPDFDEILESHLIPDEFIDRPAFVPGDYRSFLLTRAEGVAQQLRQMMPDVEVTITD